MDKARVDGEADSAIAEDDSFKEATGTETSDVDIRKEFNSDTAEGLLATKRSHNRNESAADESVVSH